MKAEQDPRFDMNVNRDDLQKDFEEAAKRRVDELKKQSDADKDSLKAEVDDLKNEADASYESLKAEMKDWDDPYADEKKEVEEASNKVVKKDIDIDYQDSVENLEYETDHRVDSIERLMDEDMNKEYNEGVDAIYLNQSENEFQHQKDHYADRKADHYSDNKIKASYDDITEANAADNGVSAKGCGCSSTHKNEHYTTNQKADQSNVKETAGISASADNLKNYRSMYGDSNSCKASTNLSLQDNSSHHIKATSTTNAKTQDYSDRIKDYTTEKPQAQSCGNKSTQSSSDKNTEINTRLKNSNVQDNLQESTSMSDDLPGYTITEEYVMIITDDSSTDDNQQDSADEYKSQIGQDSYYNQNDRSYNEAPGMKCSSSTPGPQSYSKTNNIQNNTAHNEHAKANNCSYDLKQDILDEADRVMGDDMI